MINAVSYPNLDRNYCLFDENKIQPIVDQGEKALPVIKKKLDSPSSESEIIENLYILNLMLDNEVQGIADLYPTLSKYNQTESPNIQTFLAGIYRKIKVPDAFGPLCVMLIRNATKPPKECFFDPNEEIGGAILDYLA